MLQYTDYGAKSNVESELGMGIFLPKTRSRLTQA